MSEQVLTRRDRQVFEITLNRPRERNAISDEMMQALAAALDRSEQEFHRGARVVVLRGAGRVFSSGIDLAQFHPDSAAIRETQANLFPFTARYQGIADQLERCSLPVIAVMQGYCIGLALELALACDFRIAAERTKFSLPETRLGIIPDVGGTVRLVQLLGVARAKELILTGRTVDAAQALAVGLLNAVYPREDLDAGLDAWVTEIMAAAPLALSYGKRVINDIANSSAGARLEAWAQAQLFRTADFQNAVRAMADKTYPVEWRGE